MVAVQVKEVGTDMVKVVGMAEGMVAAGTKYEVNPKLL